MRIVVNDSSALIDLKKGGLLELLVELPFEFLVSDSLVADELLSFTKDEVAFIRRKMTVVSLSGAEVLRVRHVQSSSPALSFHDCSALVIARRELGWVLLTGDRRLRAKAEAESVECHGILWVVEELAKLKLTTPRVLLKALETWRNDITVRLPIAELNQAVDRLKN
jgi:predicted nucleic acid-binding protein